MASSGSLTGPRLEVDTVAFVDTTLHALTDADQELIQAARAVIDANTDTAHVDGAGVHTMGAAVRDSEGWIYVGVNLAHFTGGPCAELVALGTARANGARQIRAIVAVGNHGRGVIGPCGRDRQILFDYHTGIRVLLPTAQGVRATTIEALMPHAAAWTIDSGTQDLDPSRFDR
ncbi:cytidine deaminase [Microlunatus endophyticus]|uniref:Cytidine deaminase n=1 Tax=Microlunatus endophyticus TaxID=1716077 RepID=A0A917W708_9ACTN|nr:cytidine deaminase [Microlunatus endophyticus]